MGTMTEQLTQPTVSYIDRCRACRSSNVSRFLNLPDMPFTDDFVTPQHYGQEFRADIGVYICDDCLTAQTQHNVDVRDYYKDYHYSVGASQTVSRFMRRVAETLLSKYLPDSGGSKVLEIGSGDGGQLVAFKQVGCEVLGYEPSAILCEIAESKGVPTIQGS
jgi:hypothetical protein